MLSLYYDMFVIIIIIISSSSSSSSIARPPLSGRSGLGIAESRPAATTLHEGGVLSLQIEERAPTRSETA